MTINPSRRNPIRSAFVLILPFLLTGCFFNLGQHKDFASWYYGEPGMAGALGEAQCDRYADRIQGDRHRYYLHFRTPEVLLQPQGGDHYPARLTSEGRESNSEPDIQTCEQAPKGWETFHFNTVDAGLVDTVIPYRRETAVNERERGFGQASLAYAEGLTYNTGLTVVMKAPIYIVHDILKTLYIPVASTYYLLKPDEPSMTPGDSPVTTETEPAALSQLDADRPGANSESMTTEREPPIVEGDTILSDEAESSVVVDREETEGEEEEITTWLAADQDGDTAPIEMQAPSVTMSEEAPESSIMADPATEKVDPVRPNEVQAPAVVMEQTDKVAAAAAALSTVARVKAGPEPAAAQTDQADSPSTGTGPDESVWPPPDGPSAEIAEEDLLAAEVATDGRSEAETQDADREHPGEPEPSAPKDASVPLASVTPAQQAVTSETTPKSEPIDWVRIDKYKLHKKVAFIGFFTRSAGVDESTKAYLRDHLWPVFKERCEDDLTLLRSGETGYPAALDSLVRDQFGRLNSFELTTVARFSGLNAIIAATIIDIRVASAISGFLWYKSPEGQLRLTILVEVFDAETGTKLLDRTYIREEEVEELEPGADEVLRPEDRPVLEAVLRNVAEDMGEHVCETLDDLPWRAYVSGISGERVTLSAGEDAGLVAGNILKVYNSQIIDGLNNQQFFLTGEKVGRIQVLDVFPTRSEALLIEGQGLRDYSVAMP